MNNFVQPYLVSTKEFSDQLVFRGLMFFTEKNIWEMVKIGLFLVY